MSESIEDKYELVRGGVGIAANYGDKMIDYCCPKCGWQADDDGDRYYTAWCSGNDMCDWMTTEEMAKRWCQEQDLPREKEALAEMKAKKEQKRLESLREELLDTQIQYMREDK
jgi:hypothetical protein